MVRQEWKNLFKNKILMLVIIAIIAIPTIYTTLFLGSMWDPYGKVDKLPVAVVNNDRPAAYNDSTLAVGDELVENLKENDSLDFHFVDADQAEAGIKDGTYYMVITIPEDFSQNAATLMDDQPKQMILNYETNPGTNYIAMKMSESAMEKLKKSVSEEVTKTYAEALFDQLTEIGDGMQEASDGAGEIEDGTEQLADGNATIKDNLQVLADSSLTFVSGSERLEKGLKDYTAGVSAVEDGMDQLAGLERLGDVSAGIQSLDTAVNKGSGKNPSLKSGAQSVADGLGTIYTTANGFLNSTDGKHLSAMAGSIQSAANGIRSAAEGISGAAGTIDTAAQLAGSVVSEANGKIDAANSQIGIANSQISEINGRLDSAISAIDNSSLSDEEKASLKQALNSAKGDQVSTVEQIDANSSAAAQLSGISSGLKQGAGTLSATSETLSKGAEQIPSSINSESLGTLVAAIGQAKAGADAVNSGVAQVGAGISQLNASTASFPEAASGVSQVRSGLNTLTGNNETLLSGSSQLTSGAGQIADGAQKLSDGSGELGDGIAQLEEGAGELRQALQDGADEIYDVNATDATTDMFSAPIDAKEGYVAEVENNGHAMSAYMMSVALWVGCIAFCIMYPLMKKSKEDVNGFGWWFSKATVLFVVAIGMALVMLGLLHVFNGFNPADWGRMIFITCLTSVAFMSILYFFNVLLGKVGSFLMLIFMVVQLAGAAGTYPVELSGDFVKVIHPWLPFSYSVDAFRAALAGTGSIQTPVLVLMTILIVFSILTLLLFEARTKEGKEGKKNLYEILDEKGLA